VRQIISNLLSNALTFTRRGGMTIAARRNARERTVTLSVTGIGIAAADQDRVFEDFRQLDSSPTRPYGGSTIVLMLPAKGPR
jgi:signal transduction histidine kinase